MKILYIDDEPFNLILFEGMFGVAYDVHTITSGQEGLEFLQQHPDTQVVFCDQKMPGMQGLDFVKKAKVNFPDTPYYLLTGLDLSEKIADELQKGIIKGCLQKPFNKQEIEEAIRVSI